ncbi:hypothetical protein [Streptomyces sp. NBC_01320]|uniref:hypothetical protein n=1 Tax=Streptomyces sp. NBC_01320 TaxID=2903824 RepID=UPI002E132CAB|nr:hypothetical protein OG395_01725 [Streptomyces sp. NBC_01320]WSK01902.1 hypothetical protein OG395_53615 [Streptomyces sp. NBC_01320]
MDPPEGIRGIADHTSPRPGGLEPSAQLRQLVVVPAGKRLSELDRLRRSPRDISARRVGKALERYESLRAFGDHAWNLDAIPPGRLQARRLRAPVRRP